MKRLLILCLILLGAGCGPVTVKTYPNEERLHETKAAEFVAVNSRLLERKRLLVDSKGFAVYRPTSLSKINFRVTRPARDSKIVAVFAGTYTSPEGKPEGYVFVNGKVIRNDERQGWNGAALVSADGSVDIIQTDNGKVLTKDWIKINVEGKNSLFQGHLLVMNSKAQVFKEQPNYQRRALVLTNGGAEIIESEELMGLNEFAESLVKLGAEKAINLDMGGWSEGWYRNNQDEIISIGYMQMNTDKQSNWLEIVGK